MRGGSIDGPWEFGELICPTCFIVLAEERGVAFAPWWIDSGSVQVELELITPSGRVWDAVRRLWVHPDDEQEPIVDPTRCYWRVGSTDSDDAESIRVYSAADGTHIGTFLTPALARAACGGHNRDLKLERVVVLDPGPQEAT